MLSFDVRMFYLSALQIFSEFLFIINASLALWMMWRWSLMILLYCVIKSAGGLSVNAQGSDGVLPIAN